MLGRFLNRHRRAQRRPHQNDSIGRERVENPPQVLFFKIAVSTPVAARLVVTAAVVRDDVDAASAKPIRDAGCASAIVSTPCK